MPERKGGEEPSQRAGGCPHKQGQHRVACNSNCGTGSHAEDEAAVHRQVWGLQNAEGDEHTQSHWGVEQTLTQGGDEHTVVNHKITSISAGAANTPPPIF